MSILTANIPSAHRTLAEDKEKHITPRYTQTMCRNAKGLFEGRSPTLGKPAREVFQGKSQIQTGWENTQTGSDPLGVLHIDLPGL